MTKETKPTAPVVETAAAEPRGRKPRKKVYQRIQETLVPTQLEEHFLKDGYSLKLIRWSIQGHEDYQYLARRLQEGFEFVTRDELPEWFKGSYQAVDTKSHPGMITFGDLCLMKIDVDLRKSMADYFDSVTSREVDAVSMKILEKKGFRNVGSKQQIMHKEPKFQD